MGPLDQYIYALVVPAGRLDSCLLLRPMRTSVAFLCPRRSRLCRSDPGEPRGAVRALPPLTGTAAPGLAEALGADDTCRAAATC